MRERPLSRTAQARVLRNDAITLAVWRGNAPGVRLCAGVSATLHRVGTTQPLACQHLGPREHRRNTDAPLRSIIRSQMWAAAPFRQIKLRHSLASKFGVKKLHTRPRVSAVASDRLSRSDDVATFKSTATIFFFFFFLCGLGNFERRASCGSAQLLALLAEQVTAAIARAMTLNLVCAVRASWMAIP